MSYKTITVNKDFKQVNLTGLWDAAIDHHTGGITLTSMNPSATVTVQHPPPTGAVDEVHNVGSDTVVVVSPHGVVTILEK